MDKWLLILGCAVFVILGAAHLWLTLFSNKIEPRDAALVDAMKTISPMLTRQTTMWKAWVGFNVSHSLGAILFGLIYIVLALENYAYLKSSLVLNGLVLLVPVSYLVLAVKYWFRKPRNGIVVALVLILASIAVRMS